MDVTYEFQKVRIFFTDDGFISVLEEVTASFVAFVKSNGIASHETTHDLAEWRKTCAQQEMEVVWNERPGVALGLSFLKDKSKSFQEGLAVLVVLEDLSTFNPPGHYMLQEARGI